MPKLARSKNIPVTPEIPRWDTRREDSVIVVTINNPGHVVVELTLSLHEARTMSAALSYLTDPKN